MIPKKAQMKMQQTVFMLVAITLLLVLVGLVFMGFEMSGIKRSVSDLRAEQARQLVSKLADSPEFSCGESFDKKLGDCIDSDKVLFLMGNTEYEEFWGVDDIKIRKIYPQTSGEIVCTKENYPNCNIFNIIKEGVVGTYDSNYVNLCRKETMESGFYNKCELAILMVSYTKAT
jgi:hypothetical protein